MLFEIGRSSSTQRSVQRVYQELERLTRIDRTRNQNMIAIAAYYQGIEELDAGSP
jgi:hypothetical protein